ncbi:MAG: SDR family oxidoreductase [Gammaproteobacteria bacterium]|nr:SDR family oxidoreductase [Gammaproteobacteria bacterium]
MDLQLKEKSVIVTGGGSNIGRAIVLELARESANITLADLDEGQAGKVAEEALKLGASDIQVIKTDVTDLANVQTMVQAARQKFGGVDVLINNVGWDDLMFFSQTTPEFWDKIIRINFLGALNCTKTVLDAALEDKTPTSIVSVSSDASRQGEAREAVYGAMKAGINSLMKSIAKENGRFGVRCNVVCPGVTIPGDDDDVGETSMWAKKDGMFTEEQFAKIAAALPLKKVGRPRDIANAVLFLSSNAVAGHVTGQVLSVSGGYSMIG